MDAPKLSYEIYQESATDKLKRKALADPFVPAGIVACVGALAWGKWAYSRRGTTSTSIFLMRLRVIAQTMVVGAMALGAGATLVKSFTGKPKS